MNDGEKVVIRTAINEIIAQIFIEAVLLSFFRMSMIDSKLNLIDLEYLWKNKGISFVFVPYSFSIVTSYLLLKTLHKLQSRICW